MGKKIHGVRSDGMILNLRGTGEGGLVSPIDFSGPIWIWGDYGSFCSPTRRFRLEFLEECHISINVFVIVEGKWKRDPIRSWVFFLFFTHSLFKSHPLIQKRSVIQSWHATLNCFLCDSNLKPFTFFFFLNKSRHLT